jgi:hypothetical protein
MGACSSSSPVTLPSRVGSYDGHAGNPIRNGPRHMPDPNSIPLFRCSNCFALYQVTKAQAGPETVDLKIACQVCNGHLPAREGQSVLKYFLLRKASRLDVQRARQGFLRAKPTVRRKKASAPNMKKSRS